MALDPVLAWTLLAEGSVQAEVQVNELLGRLLATTCRIASFGDVTPPASPDNFDAYIVGPSATDDWDTQDGNIAVYLDGWKFATPVAGMRVLVLDTSVTMMYDGTSWCSVDGSQTLVDTGSIEWDASLGLAAQITLGGDRTLAAPTGMREGVTYMLVVIQDGVGTRLLTWDAAYHHPAGTAPTLTTTASKKDIFTVTRIGSVYYVRTVGLNYA